MRKNNKDNYKQGHWAESLARIYLICKGYSCLAKNYRGIRGTKFGEIDLIMKKGKTIVFVEVKKRSSIEEAAYSILPQQQKRIANSAEIFIKKNPNLQNYDIRFDAILVKLPLTIKHIKNAWHS